MGRLIDVDNIEYYLEEGGSVVAFKADIEQIPTADIDTDSAYAEGWTAAESKYRAIMSDGDCISRQAAIDAVRDRMGKGETNIGDTFIECFEMILNALPSAQPEPQWISCERELPEDYTDVLAWFEYFRYGDYNCLYQTYGIGSYSMKYDSWTINHETGWHKLRVIAWMPLPEPWKGEQS